MYCCSIIRVTNNPLLYMGQAKKRKNRQTIAPLPHVCSTPLKHIIPAPDMIIIQNDSPGTHSLSTAASAVRFLVMWNLIATSSFPRTCRAVDCGSSQTTAGTTDPAGKYKGREELKRTQKNGSGPSTIVPV